MARPVVRRWEEGRGAAIRGQSPENCAWGLRRAGAEADSGDVGPRMAVRACSADRGGGSKREHGMDCAAVRVSVYSWP